MEEWLVKVRQYSGGESILHWRVGKEQAEELRDELNTRYQTDHYFIEKYDPEKTKGFGWTASQIRSIAVGLE